MQHDADPKAALPATPPPSSSVPLTGRSFGEPSSPLPGANASVREIGGPQGPEPTRFGDWEKNGRCIDF